MDLDRFERAARAAFAFLEDDLGMRIEPGGEEERSYHFRSLTYRSEAVFVRVSLDDYQPFFNVEIGPVIDGRIPPYPVVLERDDEPITWFPLWAILRGRGVPEPPSLFAEGESLDSKLLAWASALRQHAARALSGDFDDIREPVREVKRQEAEAARERDERLGLL